MEAEDLTGFEIAVVGMAGRFPGADNLRVFWDNLRSGKESIRFFSDDELRDAGISEELIRHEKYVKAKGYLEGAEYFDAPFFGYSNRDAEQMDPQFRLFHETVYHALEDAGYIGRYEGMNVGLFGGAGYNPFWIANHLDNEQPFSELFDLTTLNGREYFITRVAYKMGFQGPAVNVQTACSTSLVAIHMACQSLIARESDIALAGGATVLLPQKNLPRKYGVLYEEGLIVSPDGHCRPFDESAQGFASGDGVGVVALKRLEDAIGDKDQIYAVVKSSAMNNDGKQKTGFTAPGITGQSEVIKTALELAEAQPESIGFIEAHGSGTPLGDAIEIESLNRVYSGTNHPLAIGSVKANVGHLDATAGVIGFIKTVLALHHEQIPPSINHQKLNSKLNFEGTGFYVNTSLKDWPRRNTPRRAGVSSFGIGGTNAHAILEEGRSYESNGFEGWVHLPFSAKTPDSLSTYLQNTLNFLKANPDTNLKDFAFSLQVGRGSYDHKLGFVSNTIPDLIRQLEQAQIGAISQTVTENGRNSIVYALSDLGKLEAENLKCFYEQEPLFQAALNESIEAASSQGVDLTPSLFAITANNSNPTEALLREFAVQYALGTYMMHLTTQPNAITGHGISRVVALCLSAYLSVDQGIDVLINSLQLLSVREGEMPENWVVNDWTVEAERRLSSFPTLSQGLEGIQLPDIPFLSDFWRGFFDPDTQEWASETDLSQSVVFRIGETKQSYGAHKVDVLKLIREQNHDFFPSFLNDLWLNGIPVKSESIGLNSDSQRISIPGYAFEKISYWPDPKKKFIGVEKAVVPVPQASSQNKVNDPSRWFYLPSWELVKNVGKSFNGIFDWLVFTDDSPWAKKLIDLLLLKHQRVVQVSVGETFRENEGAYEINPYRIEDYQVLIANLGSKGFRTENVVHCWTGINYPGIEKQNTWDDQMLGYHSLTYLSRAFYQAELIDQQKYFVVTNGLYDVQDHDHTLMKAAFSLGVSTVLPIEFSGAKALHIDLQDPGEYTADQLLQSFIDPPVNSVHRIEGKRVWKKTFQQQALTDPGSEGIQPMLEGKTFVIVGGLCERSQLGFILANYLVEQLAGRVVLVSRTSFQLSEGFRSAKSAPFNTKMALLDRLRQGTTQIDTEVADVTDFNALKSVFDRIQSAHGTVHGVVNVAGVMADESWDLLLNSNTSKYAERQYAVKVEGTLNLFEVVKDMDLDFCLQTSSLASLMGPFAPYAGGNAFVDLFSERINPYYPFWKSINWDHILAPEDDQSKQPLALNVAEVIQVFEQVISQPGVGQVVVSTADLKERLEGTYPSLDSNAVLGGKKPLDRWLYQPEWKVVQPQHQANEKQVSAALIFALDQSLHRNIETEIRKMHQEIYLVHPANNFDVQEKQVGIRPENEADYQALFKHLESREITISDIYHLWTASPGADEVGKSATEMQDMGIFSLIPILKYRPQSELSFRVLTSNINAVRPEDVIFPEFATLKAVLEIAPREIAGVNSLLLEVDMKELTSQPTYASQLGKGLVSLTPSKKARYQEFSFRSGQYYERRFINQQAKVHESDTFAMDKGTYLFTGGLGGMSLEIAQYLTQQVDCTILLLDSLDLHDNHNNASGFDLESIHEKVETLRSTGSEVTVHRVNVGNKEDMQCFKKEVLPYFNRIDGVFHTAGAIDEGGFIQQRNLESIKEHLSPKLAGTRLLDEILDEKEVGFYVYFSSIGSIYTPLKIGQVAYNAGHAYLEALAHQKRKQGQSAYAINWNDWEHTGMVARAEKQRSFSLRDHQFSFAEVLNVKPHEGLLMLEAILRTQETQVVTSAFDLKRVRDFIEQIELSDIQQELKSEEPKVVEQQTKPTLELVTPENELQAVLLDIFRELFGTIDIGLDDDFFDLGGDSLKAISAISMLQRKKSMELTVTDFFSTGTVREICELLEDLYGPSEAVTTAAVSPELTKKLSEEPFDLTPLQMAYMMGRSDHFQIGGISTNVYQEGRLDVDLEVFQQTFDQVLKRHPMLRAVFLSEGKQRFLNVDHYEIENQDLRHLSDEEQEKAIIQARLEYNNLAFDHTVWPLFKIKTLTISDGQHYLFFVLDHIICDAASILIFVSDWDKLLRDKHLKLPDLEYTFKDYVEDLEKFKSDDRFSKSKAYWMQKLPDFPLPPTVPLRCDPAKIRKPDFRRLKANLNGQEWQQLQQRAQKGQTTPATLLITTYAKVLSEWSERTRVAINLTLFNRFPFHDDVPKIVGDFTTLLMLDVDFGSSKTVLDTVSSVQNTLREALDHRYFDGVEFIREFRKEHQMGIQAIMPYVFTSALFGEDLIQSEEIEVLNFWRDQRDEGKATGQTSQVYLDCVVSEMGEELEMAWDFVDDLFDPKVIEAMFDHFVSLVKNMLTGDERELLHSAQLRTNLLQSSDDQFNKHKRKAYWHTFYQHQEDPLQLPIMPGATRRDSIHVHQKEVSTEVSHFLTSREGALHHLHTLLSAFDYWVDSFCAQTDSKFGVIYETGATSKMWLQQVDILSDESYQSKLDRTYDQFDKNLRHAATIDDWEASIACYPDTIDPIKTEVWFTNSVGSTTYLFDHFNPKVVFVLAGERENYSLSIHSWVGELSKTLIACYGDSFHNILEMVGHDNSVNLAQSAQQFIPDSSNVIDVWNDTNTPYNTKQAIHELFELQVRSQPDAIALLNEKEEITYDELNQQSNQIAHLLLSLNGLIDEKVIVLQNRSPRLVASLLGILKGGGTYVPVEPYLPKARLATIIQSVQARVFIIDSSQLELMSELADQCLPDTRIIVIDAISPVEPCLPKDIEVFTQVDLIKVPSTNPAVKVPSSQQAYIIFTSGSTGVPKGVVVTHRPVINLIEWARETYQFGPLDRVLFNTSVSFDLSVFDIFGMLAFGGSIFVLSSQEIQNPAIIARYLVTKKITFWNSAPQALVQVLSVVEQNLPDSNFNDLRLSFVSGDWVPLDLPGKAQSLFPNSKFIALGGATEATVWSNFFEVDKVLEHWPSVPYGRPMQNARYYVLDARLQPRPIGTPGDLYIGGECLAEGYHGDPELSSRKFIKDPYVTDGVMYRTGDKARWWENGLIEFLGREDDQVKIRGFRVELGEIQSHMKSFPSISDAVVTIKQHDGQNYPVGYYCGEGAIDHKELRDFLMDKMPDYMVPFIYFHLTEIPTTANGKVNRKALPEPELKRDENRKQPETAIEQEISEIWRELLQLSEEYIGTDQSFFELGGHSMKVTQLMNEVNDKYPVMVPLEVLFVKDTIMEQAQYIETQIWLKEKEANTERSDHFELHI